jgi:hypothetical protein
MVNNGVPILRNAFRPILEVSPAIEQQRNG